MNFVTPLVIHEKPVFADYLNQYSSEKIASYAYNNAVKVWVRTRLSESQNHRCCWCGRQTTELPDRPHSATIEHILPKSQGGTNDFHNLAMACRKCNAGRGTMSVEEFLFGIGRPRAHRPKSKDVKKANKKSLVFSALKNSPTNPFEENTKEWKMFNYYSAKLSYIPVE